MTKFATILRIASLACVCGGFAVAQDAMTILKGVTETYSALKSYEFQGNTINATVTGKATAATEEDFTIVFTAPDHFLVEFRYPKAGEWTRASNGTTMTEIRTVTKEFTQRPTTQFDIRVLDNSPIGAYYDMEKGISQATVAGSETLTLEGQPVDCWVIEANREVDMVPDGVKRLPTKFWIDKARKLVLKQESGTESLATGSKAAKNTKTITITLVKLNSVNDPAVFEPQGGKGGKKKK
jgi:outer membrane lipoprotein-sorting protein